MNTTKIKLSGDIEMSLEQIVEKLERIVNNAAVFVANLQIGDTIKFLDLNPVQIRGLIYLPAEVNERKCLVAWNDLKWYVNPYLNEDSIPVCDALERLFPRHADCPNFEYLRSNTFKVSGYCEVESYTFHRDGSPCYIEKMAEDGTMYKEQSRIRYRKPLYVVL